jgi:predicted dehydrogenase
VPVVALVGPGGWGVNILRDLRELGCTVPVVARSAGGRERALDGGAERVVERVGELGRVEGVVVATPIATHAEVLGETLELGVPVFVEKPMTSDPAAADRLAVAAPERLFVMDKWRYHPAVAALRDIAASGELGPVQGLACVRDGRGDFRKDVDTIWRHVPHDLAIALEVLGSVPPARAAVAELVDGVPVGLQGLLGGDGSPWVSVSHSATTPVRRREVRLCCAAGSAWLADGYDEHVMIERGLPGVEPGPEERPTPGEWPLMAELRAFVAHLEGGPAPRSSAADGARIVRRLADLRALAGLAA